MIKKIVTIMLIISLAMCGTAMANNGIGNNNDFEDDGDIGMNVHNSKPIVEKLSTTSITNYVIQETTGAIFDIYAMFFDANGIDTMNHINVTVISPTGNVVYDNETYVSTDNEFKNVNVTNGELEDSFVIPAGSEAGKYKIIVEMTDNEGKTGRMMIKQSFTNLLRYTVGDVNFGRVNAGETAIASFNVTNNYGGNPSGFITDVEFSDVTVLNSISGDSIIDSENFRITDNMPIEIPLGQTVSVNVSCDVPYGTHAALEGVEGTLTLTFDEPEEV